MANKALATRQRMQFRVELAQVPANRRPQPVRKTQPGYRGLAINTSTSIVNTTDKSEDK
ncbi:hypothetical protein H8L32_14150 [Undibacterium sp. CY18W]|uniref:Uncharacterized protein n=1 Tax=Undibacterium hunanense TaxID=2762292 RepID=A0ABR6ZRZ9_9BURK|nr:hypothetical protein [Undibacterium hunanense]MBC3918632.1 hypothetical protein [Undibacterium hunanense]